MVTIKKFLPYIIFFLILTFIYTYNLFSSYTFDNDFGRDLLWIFDIVHGKLTLLGPKLSFGGLYTGPYYYYIFAPFLFLSHLQPYGVMVANAILFSFLLTLTFFLLKQKTNFLFALLSILWLASTNFIIFSARQPGNAFSYITLLILYYIVVYFYPPKKIIHLLFYGVWSGLMANFHPVSLLATIPLTFCIVLFETRSKKFVYLAIKKYVLFGAGMMITFLPILIFELKHNFVIFKNTFIVKSYTAFTNSSGPASQMVASKNPLQNILVIDDLSHNWVAPSLLLLIGIIIVLFLFRYKNKKIWRISLSFLISLLFYTYLLRYQVVYYYVFPLLISAQVTLIIILFTLKPVVRNLFFLILLLYSLITFNYHIYYPAFRTFKFMSANTLSAIKHINIPKSNYNVIVKRETTLAYIGNDYRYIFRTLGYKSDDEFSYNTSQYLVMVSEQGPVQWQNEKSWEIDQFGNKKLIREYHNKNFVWYVFKKSSST